MSPEQKTIEELHARLAEVEKECDGWQRAHDSWHTKYAEQKARADKAEAAVFNSAPEWAQERIDELAQELAEAKAVISSVLDERDRWIAESADRQADVAKLRQALLRASAYVPQSAENRVGAQAALDATLAATDPKGGG